MSAPPLHERVARAWVVGHRATSAGLAGAIASLAAWLLGLPPGVHAAVAVGAAAVAGAWPRGDRGARALRWVGARVGLAYETALQASDGPDPHGLLAAVRTQGRLVVRDVAVPASAPWWLPATLLATTLWAWGAWVGAPWPAPVAPGASGPVAPPPVEVTSLPLDADALDPAADAPPPDAAARASGGGGAAPAGADGDGAGTGADGAGEASERDALERFLDGLREREGGAAELGGASAGSDEDAAADGEERGRTTAAGRDPGDAAPTAPNAPDPGGEGERTDGEQEAPAGSEAEGADGAGEEQGEGAPGGDGADDAAGPPDGATGELTEGDGDAAGAAGVDPGEDAGEAGVGAGPEGGDGDGATEGANEADALPSLLGPGPETPVGGIALPGVAGDADAFPRGAEGVAYRRAVEEALSEGEVPVPYQEVIRNYFR